MSCWPTAAKLADAFIENLSAFIREIGLPTTFTEMNISSSTDWKAIAETTVLTPGSCKKFTAEELEEVLRACI